MDRYSDRIEIHEEKVIKPGEKKEIAECIIWDKGSTPQKAILGILTPWGEEITTYPISYKKGGYPDSFEKEKFGDFIQVRYTEYAYFRGGLHIQIEIYYHYKTNQGVYQPDEPGPGPEPGPEPGPGPGPEPGPEPIIPENMTYLLYILFGGLIGYALLARR